MKEKLNIQLVPSSQSDDLLNLFNSYLLEIREYDPKIMLDENGNPVYKWFNYYWVDKNRYPIYLKLEDKVIGFALIRKLDAKTHEIAEFYVMPKYRRNGYAMWFANEILNQFKGSFEFSTNINNIKAINFWDKFSEGYRNIKVNIDDQRKYWSIAK